MTSCAWDASFVLSGRSLISPGCLTPFGLRSLDLDPGTLGQPPITAGGAAR
jgi:hypothetical protein